MEKVFKKYFCMRFFFDSAETYLKIKMPFKEKFPISSFFLTLDQLHPAQALVMDPVKRKKMKRKLWHNKKSSLQEIRFCNESGEKISNPDGWNFFLQLSRRLKSWRKKSRFLNRAAKDWKMMLTFIKKLLKLKGLVGLMKKRKSFDTKSSYS